MDYKLLVNFTTDEKPILYTIERLSELMKTLLKQGIIEEYSIETFEFEVKAEVLDADEKGAVQ